MTTDEIDTQLLEVSSLVETPMSNTRAKELCRSVNASLMELWQPGSYLGRKVGSVESENQLEQLLHEVRRTLDSLEANVTLVKSYLEQALDLTATHNTLSTEIRLRLRSQLKDEFDSTAWMLRITEAAVRYLELRDRFMFEFQKISAEVELAETKINAHLNGIIASESKLLHPPFSGKGELERIICELNQSRLQYTKLVTAVPQRHDHQDEGSKEVVQQIEVLKKAVELLEKARMSTATDLLICRLLRKVVSVIIPLPTKTGWLVRRYSAGEIKSTPDDSLNSSTEISPPQQISPELQQHREWLEFAHQRGVLPMFVRALASCVVDDLLRPFLDNQFMFIAKQCGLENPRTRQLEECPDDALGIQVQGLVMSETHDGTVSTIHLCNSPELTGAFSGIEKLVAMPIATMLQLVLRWMEYWNKLTTGFQIEKKDLFHEVLVRVRSDYESTYRQITDVYQLPCFDELMKTTIMKDHIPSLLPPVTLNQTKKIINLMLNKNDAYRQPTLDQTNGPQKSDTNESKPDSSLNKTPSLSYHHVLYPYVMNDSLAVCSESAFVNNEFHPITQTKFPFVSALLSHVFELQAEIVSRAPRVIQIQNAWKDRITGVDRPTYSPSLDPPVSPTTSSSVQFRTDNCPGFRCPCEQTFKLEVEDTLHKYKCPILYPSVAHLKREADEHWSSAEDISVRRSQTLDLSIRPIPFLVRPEFIMVINMIDETKDDPEMESLTKTVVLLLHRHTRVFTPVDENRSELSIVKPYSCWTHPELAALAWSESACLGYHLIARFLEGHQIRYSEVGDVYVAQSHYAMLNLVESAMRQGHYGLSSHLRLMTKLIISEIYRCVDLTLNSNDLPEGLKQLEVAMVRVSDGLRYLVSRWSIHIQGYLVKSSIGAFFEQAYAKSVFQRTLRWLALQRTRALAMSSGIGDLGCTGNDVYIAADDSAVCFNVKRLFQQITRLFKGNTTTGVEYPLDTARRIRDILANTSAKGNWEVNLDLIDEYMKDSTCPKATEKDDDEQMSEDLLRWHLSTEERELIDIIASSLLHLELVDIDKRAI